MITNINDFTNGFVASLAANSEVIADNLTALEIFNSAGFNFIGNNSKLIGTSEARSQEQRLPQFYTMKFELWYALASYAMANLSNADATIATFAQQIAARVMPLHSLNTGRLANVVGRSAARVYSERVVPSYSFVPNLASTFVTPLYGRTFAKGSTYRIAARFPLDFVDATIDLGIYDYKFALVESVSGTVDREGFVEYAYSPSAISDGVTYYLAYKPFSIFDVKGAPGISVDRLMSSAFLSYGLISFTGLVAG